MKSRISLTVNGKPTTVDVDTRTILVDMLRDELRLTGTHLGCATGNCGACTVILNGETVKSCCVLAADAEGQDVRTIESLSTGPHDLHPIQEAFIDNQGLQCGFCTPGMILTASELLARGERLEASGVRHALHGNLCRCTGYQSIVDAVLSVSESVHSD